MAFQSIPRDGSVFDNKTADCLNTQIAALDKTIDDYRVNNLRYHKRVQPATVRIDKDQTKRDGVFVNDSSFYIEKLFCLRLQILVSKEHKDWIKVCEMPNNILIKYTAYSVSDKGYFYYFKIEDNVLYMSGSSVKTTGDTPDDKLYVNYDFVLSENRLLDD